MLGYLYLYNLLFSLLASLQAALQTRLVPEILQNKNELIERSVDIQYFTGNTLDILSNFVASLLLGIMSYLAVIQLSFPFFVLAFLFILKLEGVGQKQNDQFEKLPPLKSLLVSSKLFFQRKSASQIIMIEAFLGCSPGRPRRRSHRRCPGRRPGSAPGSAGHPAQPAPPASRCTPRR